LSNNDQHPTNNGAIMTNATIIKVVMSSAAEAELGALFLNAKEGVYLRQILTEMDHPQPRTPLQTENTTAEGVINNKIQPKRTKAMDMRFLWLRDREAQGQFRIYWRPGKTNLADYFTKHHPPAHHVNVRTEFLTKVKDLAEAQCQRRNKGQTKSHLSQSKQLQGCAKLPNRDSRVGCSHSLATSKLVMENILNSPPRGRFSNEVSK
jgi:aspartyl/asparaginyl-tRNA synthetase